MESRTRPIDADDGLIGVGGTDAVIDVAPVRVDPDAHDLGPELIQHIRRGAIGGAIGAIDHDLKPVQPLTGREGGLGIFDIAPAPVIDALGAADILRLGGDDVARDDAFDLGLGLVRQLEAVGAKELDAIIRRRVVAGGNHDPHIRPHRAGQKPHRRRRHRPQKQHVHARAGQPRRQRVFQHIARKPRVLADDDAVAAQIERLQAIRTLCASARRPELAADYVRSGLSVEAVRARLFDQLLAAQGAPIDNKEPPVSTEAPAAPSPNTSAIYAARKKKPSRPAADKRPTP